MPDLLGGLYVLYVLLLGPGWAYGFGGFPLFLAMNAVELGAIVLAGLRRASWYSRAGRVAQRVLRMALVVLALAAVNFVLNLIWGLRI